MCSVQRASLGDGGAWYHVSERNAPDLLKTSTAPESNQEKNIRGEIFKPSQLCHNKQQRRMTNTKP